MDEKDFSDLERWINLSNARGIAGSGARETDQDKQTVEKSIMWEFSETVLKINQRSINNITSENPPLPDFSCAIGNNNIHIELTEFIDEKFIKQAKHIRSNPENPLYDQPLWFDTSFEWFSELLLKTIEKKEQRYANRDVKIDVLLIWNEALEVSIENTNIWLQKIEIPLLNNINSIYFQSWYHPSYLGRPVWSLKEHQDIGTIVPLLKTTDY